MLNILVLTRDPQLPSFRYRLAPLLNALACQGVDSRIQLFLSRCYFWRILVIRKCLREADAIYVHKLKLFPGEVAWMRRLNKTVFFDVDDAFYVKQPKNIGDPIAPSASRLTRFNAIAGEAVMSSVGNSILAERVRAAGGNPLIFPTGIDVANYQPLRESSKPGLSLIWIGLPGNLRYLEMIRPALVEVQKRFPGLRVTVVSSDFPDWHDVTIDKVVWSADTEKVILQQAHVGVMPLFDDEYSRGKCAFKLLQYMAAGLPCIASPVGANCDVIEPEVNGFLAGSTAQWVDAIVALLSSASLRERMGQAGRAKVEADYDQSKIADRLATTVVALVKGAANSD